MYSVCNQHYISYVLYTYEKLSKFQKSTYAWQVLEKIAICSPRIALRLAERTYYLRRYYVMKEKQKEMELT